MVAQFLGNTRKFIKLWKRSQHHLLFLLVKILTLCIQYSQKNKTKNNSTHAHWSCSRWHSEPLFRMANGFLYGNHRLIVLTWARIAITVLAHAVGCRFESCQLLYSFYTIKKLSYPSSPSCVLSVATTMVRSAVQPKTTRLFGSRTVISLWWIFTLLCLIGYSRLNQELISLDFISCIIVFIGIYKALVMHFDNILNKLKSCLINLARSSFMNT